MDFFRNSGVERLVSAEFLDAVDGLFPDWMASYLPFYEEALRVKADMFKPINLMPLGIPDDCRYERDGVHYVLCPDGCKRMTLQFDANFDHHDMSVRLYMITRCPDLEPKYIGDSSWYWISYYVDRVFNKNDKYGVVAKRANAYFKELTGDPKVEFSLGRTPLIHFGKVSKYELDGYYCFYD